KDRRCTYVPEPLRAGAQAEIRVLEISTMEVLGERPDGVETGTGHVKAKTNAARNIDDMAGIDLRRDTIDALDIRAVPQRIDHEGNREAGELTIVRQRRHDADIRRGSRGCSKTIDEARWHDRVRVQKDDIAVRDLLESTIDRTDESAIPRIGNEFDARI